MAKQDATLARIRRFLDTNRPPTPCLVVDLDTVLARYHEVRGRLPGGTVYYAVKANPAPEVIRVLAETGAQFDVASTGEIDLCLAQGAKPEALSYGNTVKKASDIAYAYDRGVRRFSFDAESDLDNLARYAPRASVYCRLLVEAPASTTPFGRKFGCTPRIAVELLRRGAEAGLDAAGLCFHVGSQQLNQEAWRAGIAQSSEVFTELARHGVRLRSLNLGGGFPTSYTTEAPGVTSIAGTITDAVAEHFPAAPPELLLEPGRALVAEAGMIRSEVVVVSKKSTTDTTRWVYLDIGRYNGLAETEGEAITYRLSSDRDGDPDGPVIIAGPSCDGDDVLYQNSGYRLPLTLRVGDYLDILATGAYTASYSSVCFNGFPPLPTYCIGEMAGG
ncbi:MAG: ornithine decarboxylase [Pseudonocardiaceae bacterium]|nr:ornithine decarboxylase [Pseudonocardiaceae bacterium]